MRLKKKVVDKLGHTIGYDVVDSLGTEYKNVAVAELVKCRLDNAQIAYRKSGSPYIKTGKLPIRCEIDTVLRLYHGSKRGLVGDIKPKSRAICDFGQGFYLGTMRKQPRMLIAGYPDAKFYEVSINLKGLKVFRFKNDIEWSMFIAYNRGVLQPQTYPELKSLFAKFSYINSRDAIIGLIADDRLYYVLDRFFDDALALEGLVECLKLLKLGQQVVLKTEKACLLSQVTSQCVLTDLECQKLIMERKQSLSQVESLVMSIHRKHLRGTYFSQLLKEWGGKYALK